MRGRSGKQCSRISLYMRTKLPGYQPQDFSNPEDTKILKVQNISSGFSLLKANRVFFYRLRRQAPMPIPYVKHFHLCKLFPYDLQKNHKDSASSGVFETIFEFSFWHIYCLLLMYKRKYNCLIKGGESSREEGYKF